MYIWIGCQLPRAFEAELRERCLAHNKELGLNTAAFSLPQHISLKISFETDRPAAVLDAVEALLEQETEFYVNLKEPTVEGKILWLPVEEDPRLRTLHDRLDNLLRERFGIEQHPWDRAFVFHSTLFLDEDENKLAAMKERMAGWGMRRCRVNGFWLGVSESGKAGTYRVVRRVEGKPCEFRFADGCRLPTAYTGGGRQGSDTQMFKNL